MADAQPPQAARRWSAMPAGALALVGLGLLATGALGCWPGAGRAARLVVLGNDLLLRMDDLLLWLGVVAGWAVMSGVAAEAVSEQAHLGTWVAHVCNLAVGLVIVAFLAPPGRLGALAQAGLASGMAFLLARRASRVGTETPQFAALPAVARLLGASLAVVAGGSALLAAWEGLAPRAARLAWLKQAGWDGAFLLAGPLLLASWRAQRLSEEGWRGGWLPARWGMLVPLIAGLAAAAVVGQAWLWRYPGSQATAAVVLLAALLLAATVFLFAPTREVWESRGWRQALQMGLETASLAVGLGYWAVSMAALGAGARFATLAAMPADLWPVGYRIILGLVGTEAAACALSPSPPSRPAHRTLGYGVATLAAALLTAWGHWQLAAGGRLGPLGLAGAGLLLAALACPRWPPAPRAAPRQGQRGSPHSNAR
jgi:hypothetical protein